VSWRDGVISGIAPDGGLYVPSEIPRLNPDEIHNLKDLPFYELATILAKLILNDAVPSAEIEGICFDAFNFPIELRELPSNNLLSWAYIGV
jgi:threonine synthase